VTNLTGVFHTNNSWQSFYLSASLFDRLSWSFQNPELARGGLKFCRRNLSSLLMY